MPLLLKITLTDTAKPPVWRKIHIAEEESFETLHHAIQLAFGWYNAHLWEFSPMPFQDPRIGPEIEDLWGDGMEGDISNAAEIPLSIVFERPKASFHYVYDMGDSWVHKIVLEKIVDDPAPIPMCTAGKGNCPPEDCGGIPGYYMLVEAVNNPDHPQHADMCEWLGFPPGQTWDVHAFDLADKQAHMKEMFTQ